MNLKEYIVEHNFPGGKELNSKKHSIFVAALKEATSFLDQSENLLPLRCNCILEDIQSIPLCPECTKPVSFNKNPSKKPYTLYFTEYCSTACAAKGSYKKRVEQGYVHHMKDPEVVKKVMDSNIRSNGGKHNFQSDSFIEKMAVTKPQASEIAKAKRSSTNLQVIGVDNPSKCKEIQERIKASSLREGVHFNATKEVQERKRDNCFALYGTDHPMQCDEVMNKAKKTRFGRYGNENWTRKFFSQETEEILYDEVALRNMYEEVDNTHVMASLLGVGSHRTICLAMERLGIKRKSIKSSSQGEIAISEFLNRYGINHIRNDREVLRPKEIDILIPEYKLAIEYNGIFWHSIERKPDTKYHQNKVLKLNEKGYECIQIYEDQWNDPIKREIIQNKILRKCNLGYGETVYARKCTFREVGSNDYDSFYNTNHIQGTLKGSKHVGLFYRGDMVACIGYRCIGKSIYDITRYATSCNVPGGFTKLLGYMKRNLDWKRIVTYANMDYSMGDLYIKSGFENKGMTDPNYFYHKDGYRYTRQTFMKHKLSEKLESFDKNLTEYENMKRNGYLKVYDSGSIFFVLEKEKES